MLHVPCKGAQEIFYWLEFGFTVRAVLFPLVTAREAV